jgi:hypothetical protein
VRLSEFFVNLEHDGEFLSKEENSDELLQILDRIIDDINNKHTTSIVVQGYRFVPLNLKPFCCY